MITITNHHIGYSEDTYDDKSIVVSIITENILAFLTFLEIIFLISLPINFIIIVTVIALRNVTRFSLPILVPNSL
jgi:hypothetical protein